MTKSFLLILFVVLAVQVVGQDDARAIFTGAMDQMMTDQLELSMDIEITDDKGRVKVKAYDILMAKFGDVEKTRMVMQKPERAKGITVVITNYPEETGFIEVYTPANGKVRKMLATPENMVRVGSSFILSSYTSHQRKDLNYILLEDREIDGKNCRALQITDQADSNGIKAEFLVEERTGHIVRILFFDNDGNNTGITTLSDYQSIPGLAGKIQPMQIDADDMEEKTQTRMQVLQVLHRPDLKEEDFTLQDTSN